MFGIARHGKVLGRETKGQRRSMFGRRLALAMLAATLMVASSAPVLAFDRFDGPSLEGRSAAGEMSIFEALIDWIGTVLDDAGILIDPNGNPGSWDLATPPPQAGSNSATS